MIGDYPQGSETLDLGFVAAKARKGWDSATWQGGAGLTRG